MSLAPDCADLAENRAEFRRRKGLLAQHRKKSDTVHLGHVLSKRSPSRGPARGCVQALRGRSTPRERRYSPRIRGLLLRWSSGARPASSMTSTRGMRSTIGRPRRLVIHDGVRETTPQKGEKCGSSIRCAPSRRSHGAQGFHKNSPRQVCEMRRRNRSVRSGKR